MNGTRDSLGRKLLAAMAFLLLCGTGETMSRADDAESEKLKLVEENIGKYILSKKKQLESSEKVLLKQIDRRVREIKNSQLDIDAKRARIGNIEADKERIIQTHQLPTSDELLDLAIPHADRSQALIEEIERKREKLAESALEKSGKREMEAKLLDLEDQVEQLMGSKTQIQTGDKWSGTRENQQGASSLMLKVIKAEGDLFEGELHQTHPNRSPDIMRVAGEKKGHLIQIQTNGMIRGKQRQLQFRGYSIGDRIITTVEGIGANGKQAYGWISLVKQ